IPNSILSSSDKTIVINHLTDPNPYQSLGTYLKDMGWLYKVDRNDLAYQSSGGTEPLITPEQFAEDINELIEDITSYEEIEIEVEIEYIEMEYKYIEGETIVPEVINNSWTLSY